MKQITADEWKRMKRNGYASIIEKQRYILELTDKGTCLVPVIIIKK